MNIPILMYHGVSDDLAKVPYGFLLQATDQFEACMRYLARNGYTTITLQHLYDYLRDRKPVPPKSIVLTFDDGYLDNWVFVYPILKKYGLKGTIFVVTDFVDPEPGCRPTLFDVEAKREELRWWGYLSWAEMRRMEADGVMDIQAHTGTHTWYFSSDEIIDFHHPHDSYPWLVWNQCPERKYRWLDEVQEGFVPYGAPVYKHGRSLGIRRYFEDPGLTEHLASFVSAQAAKELFAKPSWRQVLLKESVRYKEKFGELGRYETDQEYDARLRSEIVESKKILESNLGKDIQFLCWPGGAHTQQAYELALSNGYLSTTKGDKKNAIGSDPSKLHRTGAYLDSRQYSETFLKFAALPFFAFEVQSYRGQWFANLVMRSAAGLVRVSKGLARRKIASRLT